MRYMYSRVAITFVLLVLGCAVATAQEDKRVEITTTYRPEVAQATKLLVPTTIDDAPIIEPEIEYQVEPQTWQVSLETEDYAPVLMSNYDFKRAKPLYAKVGVGYPLGSDVVLRYGMQNLRVGYFGVGVEHRGSFVRKSSVDGVLRSMTESYDMANGATFGGGVFVGKKLFEAQVAYDNDIYNRYAELVSPARVALHNVGMKLRFGDDFTDLSYFNFGIEAHGGYWMQRLSRPDVAVGALNELSGGASLRLAREIGGGRFGLSAGCDVWQSREIVDYQNTRFDVGVEYLHRWGIVDFEVGVAYMYDNVKGSEKPKHRVLPRLKITFDVEKASLAPYVEVVTRVGQNGPSSLYKMNPYINLSTLAANLAQIENGVSYDMSAGITGSILATRLSYRVYAGVNLQRDQLFWYVDNPGTFGVTTGKNDRLFYGVEIGVRPITDLSISAGFHGHADSVDFDTKYYSSEPKFRADAKVEYLYKNWKFYAGADVIGSRVWSGVPSAEGYAAKAFEEPMHVNLQLGGSYRVKSWLEVYIDGYNLLNNRIYDYAYYYRNGIGFMCGVKLDF